MDWSNGTNRISRWSKTMAGIVFDWGKARRKQKEGRMIQMILIRIAPT